MTNNSNNSILGFSIFHVSKITTILCLYDIVMRGKKSAFL